MIPRGIRNNNPLNLKKSPIDWLGLSDEQTDPVFFQFSTAIYGIRAAARILKTYQREGVQTLQETIGRWSPPEENNTQAYVQAICTELGVDPGAIVDLGALLPRLIPAMIEHENGEQPYSSNDINYAIGLA